MLNSERGNLIKWDGSQKPFYENYYLKLNDPSLGTALWVRYIFLSPSKGEPSASVWATFFNESRSDLNLSLKETVSLKNVVYRRGEFNINIGGALLKNDSASGKLVQDGHFIEWNLCWRPNVKCFSHLPGFLKFTIPNLSVPCVGNFAVDGVNYGVNTMLHQGHTWGKSYPSEWAWANCCTFLEDKNAVLEMVANPHFGLGFLKWGDKSMRFMIKGKYKPAEWAFEGRGIFKKVKGVVTAKNFVELIYQDPSGGTRICKNSSVASAVIEIGGKTLTSRNSCAFETVST